MMFRRFFALFLFCVALMGPRAIAQEPYSVVPAKLEASAYLPDTLLAALNRGGVRITTTENGLDVTVAEIFWAKQISLGKPVSKEMLYGEIQPGELVGVIHFLTETSERFREDSRDQKLHPGFYTLRYAQIPEDRDVSPYREFLVLSPVGADREPALVPDKKINEYGRLASHTAHPAILSMVPVEEPFAGDLGLRSDDAGRCILQAKLKANSDQGKLSDFGLAFILVTPDDENGAS